MKPYLLPLFFLILSTFTGFADFVRTYLSSAYIIRGEETQLIIESNGRLSDLPELQSTADYKLEFLGKQDTRNNRRQFVTQYVYRIKSYEKGVHEIPSFEFSFNGAPFSSAPQYLHVYAANELNFKTININDEELTYATAIRLPSRELYEGETVPAEVKLYLPNSPNAFSVMDKGLPELERDGISAWRFEGGQKSNTFFLPEGRFYSMTYHSSAYALRSGEVSLGKGSVRPVFRMIVNTRGLARWQNVPVEFPLEQITINAKPLPPNAPESFNGAIGDFTIKSSVEERSRTSFDDPITIDLTVEGSGNLDILKAPALTAEEGDWKIIGTTKEDQDTERRFLTGTRTFTQILRPLKNLDLIPPYELSYFDPYQEQYKTVKTPPIFLDIKASAVKEEKEQLEKKQNLTAEEEVTPQAPAEEKLKANPIPQESMTDVLALVDPLRAEYKEQEKRPLWHYWQIIPALLFVMILGLISKEKLIPRLRPSSQSKKAKADLSELKTISNDKEFLKEAVNFATKWISKDSSDFTTQLTERRDQHCFSSTPFSMKKNERSQLLKELMNRASKTFSLLLLCLVVLQPQSAEAVSTVKVTPESYYEKAQEAADAKNYSTAISYYFEAHPDQIFPADVLYNLGTLYALDEKPGKAALFFRRTLQKAPDHREAAQNLRFIERSMGSIIVERRGIVEWLSNFPQSLINTLLIAFIWIFLLLAFSLVIVKRRTYRALIWTGLVLSFFLLPLAATAKFLYPSDGEFSAIEDIAIVTSDGPVLIRTAASHSSAEVIKAPPGSLCKLVDQRGLWAYVEFANTTRGWINTESLELLQENSNAIEEIPTIEEADL